MAPHIRGRSRWSTTTVAIAITSLLVLLAPAAASAQGAPAAAPAWLDPQAGWHGRAIERPEPARTTTAQASSPTTRTVSSGDGFGSRTGSPAVRRVQRILRQLGYATGTIDGRFGPTTRSAVGWFQVKHGLTVDGVAGPRTLEVLRERAGAGAGTGTDAPGGESTQDAGTGSRPGTNQDEPTPAPQTTDAAEPGDRWVAAAVAVAAILAATLIGLLLRRRRRADDGTVVALAQPMWVAGTSKDPRIGRFAGRAAALHVTPPSSGSDTPPAIRYCVIDDDTGAPVWVAPDDIEESRGLRDGEHRSAPGAPVVHPRDPRTGRFTRAGTRPRQRGPARRPVTRSHVEQRVTWFRSLGMPSHAIADLLREEDEPPPPGHATWTAEAVDAIGDRDETSAAVGRPAQAGGPSDAGEGRSD